MDITGCAFVIGGWYLGVPPFHYHGLTGHLILASGIGRSCAIAFAKSGARSLVLGDINFEAAQAVVEECRSCSTNVDFSAEGVAVDVTLEGSVKASMDHAVKRFGRIDYCVNSAGVSLSSRPNV